MLRKIIPALAAAAAMTIGGALYAAPANAERGQVVQIGYKSHQGGRHYQYRNYKRQNRKWRHSRRRWSAYPWGCHWEQRPHRVRIHDPYRGWYRTTIWRPVHICR